jgi:hypothetical protein
MSTSGTTGRTLFEVDDLMSQAVQLCGLPASRLTPENVVIIKRLLTMLLIEFGNLGVNLWTISRRLFGLYPGEVEIALPVGTIDVLNYSMRLTQRMVPTSVSSTAGGTVANLSDSDVETVCTQSAPDGSLTFEVAPPVNVVGLLPGASGTWSFVFEESLDGITWTTIKTVSELIVVDRRWVWYQLEPSVTSGFFRIRGTDTTTLVLREAYLCGTYYDIPMARLNKDDYASLPYKQFPSQQTLQFWLDRQADYPRMVLWPSPQTTFACVWIALEMQIQDVGTQINTLSIPDRALPGIQWGLARDVCLAIPGADMSRYPNIKERAGQSIPLGRSEERDLGPIFIGPDISVYTR